MDEDQRSIIGIQRASGGLGSSTLAGAVAVCAAEVGGSALLVDLAPHGGGLDHLLGCGHEPGGRWSGLAASVPPTEAGAAHPHPPSPGPASPLPSVAGVHVLSHGLVVPTASTLDAGALRCLTGLARRYQVTVLDLPSPDHPRAPAWRHLCDTVVLMAGSSPGHAGAALVVRAVLPRMLGVVIRPSPTGGVHGHDLTDLLGAPLLGVLEHDPDALAAQLEQRPPGTRPGPLRDMAMRILAEIVERRGRQAAA